MQCPGFAVCQRIQAFVIVWGLVSIVFAGLGGFLIVVVGFLSRRNVLNASVNSSNYNHTWVDMFKMAYVGATVHVEEAKWQTLM